MKNLTIILFTMFLYSCSGLPKNQSEEISIEPEETKKSDSVSQQIEEISKEKLEKKVTEEKVESTTTNIIAFQPEFINIEVDTSQLFGIWTQDPTGPHADFMLTDKSYYIVDSEVDGNMNYILEGKILKIITNDGDYSYEIISTGTDSLVMANTEYGIEMVYTKWKN
jgi:hypothetical protein